MWQLILPLVSHEVATKIPDILQSWSMFLSIKVILIEIIKIVANINADSDLFFLIRGVANSNWNLKPNSMICQHDKHNISN